MIRTKTGKIALIAHDSKKPDMVAFLAERTAVLKQFSFVATGTTGSYVQQTGLHVELKLSGPMGGDAQIAAMVAERQLDMVIFFRDPLGKHPHEPDVQMLMRICDVHNIPLATNPQGADYLLKGYLEEGI